MRVGAFRQQVQCAGGSDSVNARASLAHLASVATGRAAGNIQRSTMEAPAKAPAMSPFLWRRLAVEWLAWGAGALVVAFALHALYVTLGIYA